MTLSRNMSRHSRQKNQKLDAMQLQLLQNCIIKYNGFYCRAKISAIYGNDTQRIFRFFICDLACFVTCRHENLANDFYYESKKAIVEFMPYKSVHGTLAGIQLNSLSQYYKLTKERLAIYVIKERSVSQSPLIEQLGMYSYEVLLYEYNAGNFESVTLLNRSLVNEQLATLDKDTMHYLDLQVDPAYFSSTKSLSEDIESESEVRLQDPSKFFERICDLHTELIRQFEDEEAIEDARPLDVATKKPNEIHKLAIEEVPELVPLKPIVQPQPTVPSPLPKPSSTTLEKTHNMPILQSAHKRPHTTWFQTDFMIFIFIDAPDIKEYYLEVSKDTLIFHAIVREEPRVLILNFLGTVDPNLVSHEVRGLQVLVRLVKSLFVKWPRLLQQATKYSWLTYNMKAYIDAMDKEIVPGLVDTTVGRVFNDEHENEYENWSDEPEPFETFNPIINGDQIYDPTNELY